MKLISGKPLSIKWPLILAIIFYGLYFLIGNNLLGNLCGTLGLLFLLTFVVLSIIHLVNKFRNN